MAELPLVGEEFAGYRLVSVLGRGGMSIVFRAENPRLGNVIALKVLDPSLAGDDIFRARFLEESRIAASMNHPNVVPIHDMGSSGGLLYIAMRCVTGTDLRQMLKKRGRLAPETAVFLLSQAARALDAAHRRGLVHRDVKPGNLLVERGNDGADPDHVYLADFGITKDLSERTGLTATEAFLGTVDYVAPEQIRGLSVLGLADQYSLGCVLYECLTGRVPFEKDLNAAIVWAHLEETPTPPTMLRPGLPPALDEVFARVLAKRPGDRYETCREFMAAAREALGPLAEPAGGSESPHALLPLSAPNGYLAELPSPELTGYPAELAHEGDATFRDPDAPWPGGELTPGPVPAGPVPAGLPAQPAPAALAVPPLPPGPRRRSSPRRRRRRRWLVVLAAIAVAVGASAGVTLTLTGNSGTPVAVGTTKPAPQPTAGATMSASPVMSTSPVMSIGPSMSASPAMSASLSMSTSPGTSMASGTAMAPSTASCTREQPGDGSNGPTTLSAVLADANSCSVPKYLIPPAKCAPQAAPPGEQVITCTSPIPQIAQVTFRTYPTLSALYGAYTAEVSSLDAAGTFRQNTGDSCGDSAVLYAEAGWNHQELHPRQYTVAEMAAGTVPQLDAMGRLACFAHGKSQDLVWTTGVGRMLAVATGTGAPRVVYDWWAAIHHVIIFPGTEMCGMSGRMESVPLGNLIQAPVCPASAG